MSDIFIREKQTYREGNVKTEADNGVMQQQAKEHLEPLESEGGKEQFSVEPSESIALLAL